MKIELRPYRVTDAKRFYEILTAKKFLEFGKQMVLNIRIGSVEKEKKYLTQAKENFKKRFTCAYAILADKKIVGGIEIKINQHRKYIGEVGYFLDADLWGKGITTEALKQINKIGFKEFDLKRLEIIIHPKNTRSIRTAEKAGYGHEGIRKNAILGRDGKLIDGEVLSKVSR